MRTVGHPRRQRRGERHVFVADGGTRNIFAEVLDFTLPLRLERHELRRAPGVPVRAAAVSVSIASTESSATTPT